MWSIMAERKQGNGFWEVLGTVKVGDQQTVDQQTAMDFFCKTIRSLKVGLGLTVFNGYEPVACYRNDG